MEQGQVAKGEVLIDQVGFLEKRARTTAQMTWRRSSGTSEIFRNRNRCRSILGFAQV
jgi:hypothetical protein